MPRLAPDPSQARGARTSLVAARLPLATLATLATLVVAMGTRPAWAGGDDRAVTDALIKSTTPLGPPAVIAEAIEHANEATERATRLRAAGDEVHAKVADGLAREWAETARDVGLAAAAEQMADDRKRQAIQAQAQLQRTKALVEESIARLGRLRAELDAASGQARSPAIAAAGTATATRPKPIADDANKADKKNGRAGARPAPSPPRGVTP
jgi:hypothetical protein